jgi:hypothetical protein
LGTAARIKTLLRGAVRRGARGIYEKQAARRGRRRCCAYPPYWWVGGGLPPGVYEVAATKPSLAVGAVATAVAEAATVSMFLAMITVPVGLYAALAAPRVVIPVALAVTVAGIANWVHVFVSAIQGSSH